MNKLVCGIVALGLMAGSLFAADSYYIFSGSNIAAWGTENYVYGYTYGGTVTLDNPVNPHDAAGGKDFVNEGVGKIVNASVPASSGVFIAVNKSGGAANTKAITDCSGGFTYWYKGGAHDLNLEYDDANCTGSVKWNNKWRVSSVAVTSWTKKTVLLTNLVQVAATGGCDKAVDLSIAEKLAWGTEATGTGYNLMIGNVVCVGSGAAITGDAAPTADFAWAAAAEETCSGKYCKWGTACGVITTDKSGAGGTVTATCTEAEANCLNNSPSHSIYSNSTCTTVSQTLPSSSSTPASTSSSSVAASGSSSSVVAGGSSSSVVAGGSSSSGASDGTSSSSEYPEPIISHNGAPVVGLNVVNFARSLRIASDKNATISLFDINGKLVLSQKVLSGTTTISLANQKVGVYYAVAKSSSQKQIVKIVLK